MQPNLERSLVYLVLDENLNRIHLLNRPSATPFAAAAAGIAPTEDQSGMKKQPVWALILTQSSALPGPSKVDTNGPPL
jgi:hypothetical protein